MKITVGKVSPEERDEIQKLFERKNGLAELAKIVNADNKALYEKLVTDMGETSMKFQKWWDNMSLKYQWKKIDNGKWEINFDTCEVSLVNEESSRS